MFQSNNIEFRVSNVDILTLNLLNFQIFLERFHLWETKQWLIDGFLLQQLHCGDTPARFPLLDMFVASSMCFFAKDAV